MQKILFLLVFPLLVIGCKKGEKQVADNTDNIALFTFQDMPRKQPINQEAQNILNEWQEFKDLESSFEVFDRAGNNEDLILAIDDLLEKEKALGQSAYPETFDKPQIKSRQRIFRTFLLKTQASLADQTDVNEPIKQMLGANNALRKQFNVLVNNKLDIELILNEK
ncbi:hypothetical protein [uncultured Croceitalea sp.]|uniref:hypothetical protein n=1 Tax=uncultured Croceitalea sp. TaxID=1798908 RepID=UPI0033059724